MENVWKDSSLKRPSMQCKYCKVYTTAIFLSHAPEDCNMRSTDQVGCDHEPMCSMCVVYQIELVNKIWEARN